MDSATQHYLIVESDHLLEVSYQKIIYLVKSDMKLLFTLSISLDAAGVVI
ncbi:hypothetical protein SAMN02745123_03329 [Desulforamulus aeronauticus DSM 10349]|uniref:Uncharacterized protein n=1 Tax=Desulforamulus aeronauticus DSM 10349 TaxID=1121421 RepID=A0A1M6VSC6_9FIRM|nr:hypothetical protein SAMN02745123_03329 [Desulforamulus aeronauticus DSM 10349]